jgi:hypothetical protein
MTPYLNDAVVRDRLARPRQQADHRRTAKMARAGELRRSAQHSIRDAVGHGLIAIGARLVDKPPSGEERLFPRAA